MSFKGNPVLFYDVGVWGKMGMAVPNWGPRMGSANLLIQRFVRIIGRNLQALMLHPDAMSASPPSLNTIIDIHKLVIRARDLLSSEMVVENALHDEPVHAIPDKQAFLVFPTPFFGVRNDWMKTYAQLVLCCLSELMQSTENDQGLEISSVLAGVAGMYLKRLYKLFCIELLKINQLDPNFPTISPANGPDGKPILQPNWGAFTLSADQIYAYAPSKWYTSTELIDTVAPLDDIPSAYDLLPVTQGIPIPELPPLGPYPFLVADSALDSAADPATLNPSGAAGNNAAVKQITPGGSTSVFAAAPGGL